MGKKFAVFIGTFHNFVGTLLHILALKDYWVSAVCVERYLNTCCSSSSVVCICVYLTLTAIMKVK